MILLDTNLLTRMTRSHEPQAGMARAAIQTLRGRGELLVLVPQNLYEFWVVATRPPGAPPAGATGWECPLPRLDTGCASSSGVSRCFLTARSSAGFGKCWSKPTA